VTGAQRTAHPELRRRDSPYVGLDFYTEDDGDWFFGREPESSRIITNLQAARLTLLHAESGVGKSSLLRAGVAWRLHEARKADDTVEIPVVFSAWKDDPVGELIDSIAEAIATVRNGGPSGSFPQAHLDQAIDAATKAVDGSLVVVLDQFEEYFLYMLREPAERSFVDELARCVKRIDLRANFLIAIREDAYSRLGDLFAGKLANVYSNYLQLDYLDRDSARETIVKPIERFNQTVAAEEEEVEIEPALVEAVLDQVRTGEVVIGQIGQDVAQGGDGASRRREEIETPYLQLVMTTLWRREREHGSRVLRLQTLNELGGAQTIVRTHLDGALSSLPPEKRATALEVFRYLVTPSGSKIVYPASDLAQMIERPDDQVARLLELLAGPDKRIVRHVPPPAGKTKPDDRYEIFHDVLAPAIIDWRRRELEQRKRAQEAQERERLEQEKRQAEESARRELRRARTFRALALVSLLLVVVAAVAVIFAEIERSNADSAKRTAESRLLAAKAIADFNNNPDEGALLALEAYRLAPTPDARGALLAALQEDQPTLNQADMVTALAVSPNSAALASGGEDGRIRFWSTGTHTQVGTAIYANTESINSVAFSPDDRTIASGGEDGAVRLWSVASHHQIGRAMSVGPQTVDGGAARVSFSPDGKLVASADGGGNVELWSVTSHRQVGTAMHDPNSSFTDEAFSPDGKSIAAADSSGEVLVWSLATRRQLGAPLYVGGQLFSANRVAFSPDGTMIAAGDGTNTVRVWSAATHRQIGKAITTSGPISAIAFGPGGKTVVVSLGEGSYVVDALSVATHALVALRMGASDAMTVAPDGTIVSAGGNVINSAGATINLWNPQSPYQPARMLPERSGATALAVSADGKQVATPTKDGRSIIASDAQSGREIGVPTPALHSTIHSLAFSPDGKLIASDSSDDQIRLWSGARGAQLGSTFAGRTSNTSDSLAFSPDGRLIASGAPGNEILLWSTATHRPVGAPLSGHTAEVSDVAFSPDGKMLASSSNDDTVRLWNVATHEPIGGPLIGHHDVVETVVFSPDGKTLASGSDDNTVLLWSVATHRQIGLPLTAAGPVTGIAFSADGKTVATITSGQTQGDSTGSTAQFWDIATGEALGPALLLPPGGRATAAFAAGGQLVTADGALGPVGALIWSPLLMANRLSQFSGALCPIVGRNLTQAEWSRALPTESYHQTCAR
jgi:WD40 repeat protein